MDEADQPASLARAASPGDWPPPRLSREFVGRWLECLRRTFGHGSQFPFARVRTFAGGSHRVCVPLLPYSHLTADEAGPALSRAGAGRAHIRHVSPLPPDAAGGTPVVSAIPLRAWRDATDFLENGITSNLRKKLRKAGKDGFTATRSAASEALDEFYPLFLETMHRHGTPPFPLTLFRNAIELCGAEVILVRRGDTVTVAYFILNDAEIALFMWAGFNPYEDAGYSSLVGEWEAIGAAFARGCAWFDLGRAPLGSAAWRHKQYWHPLQFRCERTPPAAASVYDKYRLPAAIWRKLPAGIARALGPRMIRHLPDA